MPVTHEEGDRYPLGPPDFRILTAKLKHFTFMAVKSKADPVV
jgi:hypothetical protein